MTKETLDWGDKTPDQILDDIAEAFRDKRSEKEKEIDDYWLFNPSEEFLQCKLRFYIREGMAKLLTISGRQYALYEGELTLLKVMSNYLDVLMPRLRGSND